MADETITPPVKAAAEEALPIEQLAAEEGTESWALAGLKARLGWPMGKLVTRTDYRAAMTEWLGGPTVQQEVM